MAEREYVKDGVEVEITVSATVCDNSTDMNVNHIVESSEIKTWYEENNDGRWRMVVWDMTCSPARLYYAD